MRRIALAVLAAALASPAAAGAVTRSSESGDVRAVFTWDAEMPTAEPPRLTIVRAGVTFGYAPARCAGEEGELYCERPYPDRPGVVVSDLDGDGEPEVVVQLYTGGAHCCFVSVIHRWDGAGYVALRRGWADGRHVPRDVDRDGRLEFVGYDARFAYLFGGYGDSRMPVRVLRYADGGFADVSRDHPALLRRDVRRHLRTYRAFRRGGWDCEGVLAAYMAGKVRLGEGAAGWRTVRAAMRRDELQPGGERYVRRLRRLLRLWGYLPA